MKLTFILIFVCLNLISANPKKDVLGYFKLVYPNQSDLAIEKTDLKNGYIRYSQKSAEGFSEFAIWIKKNKEVIAAETSYGCGPACSLSSIKFYEFNGENYTEVTNKFYPAKKIEAIFKKRLAALSVKDKENDPSLWILIPKKGTTILIGINKDPISVDNILNIAELKWNGNSFDLVEKK
jgi:hypothetical protein